MIKETIKKSLDKAKDATKQYIEQYIEEHSDNIGDIVVGTVATIFVLGVGINWAGKLIPSRTNLHVYVHLQ